MISKAVGKKAANIVSIANPSRHNVRPDLPVLCSQCFLIASVVIVPDANKGPANSALSSKFACPSLAGARFPASMSSTRFHRSIALNHSRLMQVKTARDCAGVGISRDGLSDSGPFQASGLIPLARRVISAIDLNAENVPGENRCTANCWCRCVRSVTLFVGAKTNSGVLVVVSISSNRRHQSFRSATHPLQVFSLAHISFSWIAGSNS